MGVGEMAGFKYGPALRGWDDEKVYFADEAGKTWCVSDHPELVARLMDICRDYFAQRVDARSHVEERVSTSNR